MVLLRVVVILVDFQTNTDRFDDGIGLISASLTGFLRRLILELAVVHQFGDGRFRVRGDFNEIEVCFLGETKRVLKTDDTYLLTGRTNKAHFIATNALINSWFVIDDCSFISMTYTQAEQPRST